MRRLFLVLAAFTTILSCHKEAEKHNTQLLSPNTIAKKQSAVMEPVVDTVFVTQDVRIYADKTIDKSKFRDVLVKFKPYIHFSDFSTAVDNTRRAKLDLSSHQYGRTYRTSLRNEFASDTANFAGHYTLVTNGCGSPCQISLLIDRQSGKIYDAPSSSTGVDYRADSRMFIVNPPEESGYYYSNCAFCIPEIYIFNERTKTFEEIKP